MREMSMMVGALMGMATAVFDADVGPDVATINSRVDFTVGDDPADNWMLVYGVDNAFPGFTLPITIIRGLTLLGLTGCWRN